MSRLLVIYGTTDGHTAKIANFVGEALRSKGFAVEVAQASDAPMKGDYDAVFVAASVHAGGYQRCVAGWVTAASPLLSTRPSAFLSVCLGVLQHEAAVDADLWSIRQRFLTRTGWQPDETKVVAGALPYTQYGWIKRFVMKRIASKAGGDTDTSRDFEYTDWNDLRRFVDDFIDRNAARIAAAPQSQAAMTAAAPQQRSLRRRLVRAALGATLIFHGLANAVLPMRAVDAVAPGIWAPANAALYVGAIAGFVAAGLAVLGVRPLRQLATSLAVAAGLCALVAQVVLRSGDLWVGVVLSLALPMAVWLWSSASSGRRSPVGPLHKVGDALGLAFLAWIALATGFWPHYRTWGASPQEWQLALPGDRSPRHPEFEILSGVTIQASPDTVWPWLAQLGQDRAGFYSYDALERLFGDEIHNVRELRREWQTRQTGDLVPATQINYLGGLFGPRLGWTVSRFEPGRALVLENWGAFVLLPTPDGGTRFLIRSTISHGRIPAWAAAINLAAFELPHFIMQRRMMLTIKELAEHPA